MTMANNDIRQKAKLEKVFLWQIAMRMGIGEITLIRRLRAEFSEVEKEKVFTIIEELKKEKERE